MIRGPDARSGKFLMELGEINGRLTRAERQVTSGRRVNQASDAPDEVGRMLTLRSNLSHTEQLRSALGRVKTEIDTAEGTLTHAIELVERVETLGAQGASDFTPADARLTIAAEIEGLLGRLVGLANTQLEGRYLFAGDADQTVPYTFDPSQTDPVGGYQGGTNSRQFQDPAGPLFSIARSADTIFDSTTPENNVFDSVNALRLALRANDGQAIRDAVATVRSAHTHLTNELAAYGGIQNRVAGAVEFAHKQELRLKQEIGAIEDADMTAAIIELNQARFLRETALSVEARAIRQSLFNYLR
jgi:flagellar hook-associated protein 3 FlgL